MSEQAIAIYAAANELLIKAGLMDRLVMQTPRWEAAAAAVQAYWTARGRAGPPMGPGTGDSWSKWLHVASHSLSGEHGTEHAACELELVRLAIFALGEEERA